MQNLPVDAGRCDEVESRSHTGMVNMWVDTHGIAIHVNMAGDTQRCISTCTEGMKLQDLLIRGTKPCRDRTDGLESCPGMQTACVHAQDVGKKSNKPANMSVMRDLPANGTEPCIGVPNRLECQADTLDACTCMQGNADDSIRPTDNLECVRRSQNGCKRLNLPAKPLKSCPEEPRKPSS